jgi:hypothetical protein
MKRLFESDNASRVEGIQSFAELEAKLNEAFAKCPEALLCKLAVTRTSTTSYVYVIFMIYM